MSRTATIAAARARSTNANGSFGLLPFEGSSGSTVDVRLTAAAFASQVAWLAGRLREAGIRAGSLIVNVAHPIETLAAAVPAAAAQLGATVGFVDTYVYETPRLRLFISRLQPDLIVGVTAAMAEATADSGCYDGVTVVCRPDAREAFANAGVAAGVVLRLGPAVALSLPTETELSYDTEHVDVRFEQGALQVRLKEPGQPWLVTTVTSAAVGSGRIRLAE